jgi:hypothetical protein
VTSEHCVTIKDNLTEEHPRSRIAVVLSSDRAAMPRNPNSHHPK